MHALVYNHTRWDELCWNIENSSMNIYHMCFIGYIYRLLWGQMTCNRKHVTITISNESKMRKMYGINAKKGKFMTNISQHTVCFKRARKKEKWFTKILRSSWAQLICIFRSRNAFFPNEYINCVTHNTSLIYENCSFCIRGKTTCFEYFT